MVVYVVICMAMLAFCITSILLQPIGRRIDIKRDRIDSVVLKDKKMITELDLSLYRRFIAEKVNQLKLVLDKYLSTKNSKKVHSNSKLQRDLRMAGLYIDADEYGVIRLVGISALNLAGLLFILPASVSTEIKLLIILAIGIFSILAPSYFLAGRITSRQRAIRNQLPEVMDLLCVSMEAGLGFDAALLKIAEKLDGPLIDNLKMLYREIQMGLPRHEALKNFGNSSDVEELKTLSSALISADALGITVINVLKVQADQLRDQRRQAAQERGMKSPVKMMLPMVLFIFPVIFIILLGPTVIQLIKQFK